MAYLPESLFRGSRQGLSLLSTKQVGNVQPKHSVRPCHEIHVGIGLTRWDTKCQIHLDTAAPTIAQKSWCAALSSAVFAQHNMEEPKQCAQCGLDEGTGAKLSICSCCMTTAYCCKEFQKKDWPKHKAARKAHRMDSKTSVTASAAAAAAAVAAATTVNPAQPKRSRGRPKRTAEEAANSHQKTLQKKREREAEQRKTL